MIPQYNKQSMNITYIILYAAYMYFLELTTCWNSFIQIHKGAPRIFLNHVAEFYHPGPIAKIMRCSLAGHQQTFNGLKVETG